MKNLSLAVPEEIAQQMPDDPSERRTVLELGIREWRIRQALDAYQKGEGSLAYAASRAGVSLREIISIAYGLGFEPKTDDKGPEPLSLEQASTL